MGGGDMVAVCIIRFRPHDGSVVMTVTSTPDVERADTQTSFATTRVDEVVAAVRTLAAEVEAGARRPGVGP